MNQEITQNKEQRGEKIEHMSITDLCDKIKRSNIQVIRVPEREKKEIEAEKFFEKVMAENFQNLVKDLYL